MELVPMDRLRTLQFAEWKGGSQVASQYPMVATCQGRVHRIWNVNAAAGVAVLVAQPVVRGSLVLSMGFAGSLAEDPRYVSWRSWVRAMFVPRALDHRTMCSGEEAMVMGQISTVGTFELGGAVYAVETHPGEIRVTDAAGSDAAVIPLKTGDVLGEAAPGGAPAPVELLDTLRECASRVLERAAEDGRGPWARGVPYARV